MANHNIQTTLRSRSNSKTTYQRLLVFAVSLRDLQTKINDLQTSTFPLLRIQDYVDSYYFMKMSPSKSKIPARSELKIFVRSGQIIPVRLVRIFKITTETKSDNVLPFLLFPERQLVKYSQFKLKDDLIFQ